MSVFSAKHMKYGAELTLVFSHTLPSEGMLPWILLAPLPVGVNSLT
jgi:hypothetical protein